MSELSQLLLGSLNPATRKHSELNLSDLSTKNSFLPHLLRLILDGSQDHSVRLAGSLYLKNSVKSRWEDEENPISDGDKASLKRELVPAMIYLSGPTDKSSRAQVAEAVSLIAKSDFPEQWPDLIDRLVNSLSPEDHQVNVGVLETIHSICQPWRAATRSDTLFTTINYVLSRFARPFLELFLRTANLLFSSPPPPNLALIAQTQAILVDIFFDLTSQDLPPDFEDTHAQFFGPDGLFLKFLNWSPAELAGDPDDRTPSLPSQIKTGILEIAELYTKLYPEVLQNSASVEAFVRAIWELLGGGKLPGVADDQLVSQSLRFLSTAIRSGHYKQLFSVEQTISTLVEGVVVPNVVLREHDLEQFEDDPLEFIRLDLSIPSISGAGLGGSAGDVMTRRQAAADVLKALVSSGVEAETTKIVGIWITNGLQSYTSNPKDNWKAKDSAVYLLGAIAAKGSTTLHGVTSTNSLINVVDFFSNHIFQDLQASSDSVHPILQVDAIRFLHTFRNQLSKDQLLTVLPHLARHLGSDNYVSCTYAAITIERILFIKHGTVLLFLPDDIKGVAPGLINTIFTKLESAGSPEKVAENEFLIKCAMRVIITARQTLATTGYEQILQRLVGILGVISKNPSNPNFDQYIFESLSALMRFVVPANPSSLSTFEANLFGPFTIILQQDIDQYIPYVFQILAQMLDLHTSNVPGEYREILPFLLTPASWQQKGSIPGLVKLLTAFLSRETQHVVSTKQFTSILAVVQQRLIPSKTNDGWGFELLQAVVQHIPPSELRQYFRAVIVTLLTRMQTSKTDKYVYHFVYFLMFTMAINVQGLTPDFLIATVEEIQPRLWSQILSNFVIPQVPTMLVKDRKLVAVGMIRMLTQSGIMLQEPSVQAWTPSFFTLRQLFENPQHMAKDKEEDPDAGLTVIDYEEQNAGYQAAYSRLAASESVRVDPVAYIGDPKDLWNSELTKLSKEGGLGGKVNQMIAEAQSQGL